MLLLILLKNHGFTQVADDVTEDSLSDDRTDYDFLQDAERIVAVSDASVDPITGEATYAWRVTTWGNRGLVCRSSFVNGNPDYMNSYRAELAGLYNMLQWMIDAGFTDKHVTISCDNEACINGLSTTFCGLSDLDKAEADLLVPCRNALKSLSQYELIWTGGHQEENIPFDELPLLAQMNVLCDSEAKESMEEGLRPPYKVKLSDGVKAELVLGNHIVTNNLSEQIHLALHRPRLHAYAIKKYGWTEEQVRDIVNWKCLGLFKRTLKIHESVRHSKMIWGWLNVGDQKMKFGGDGRCPCCGDAIESQLHLYSCTHPDMSDAFYAGVAEITSNLVKEGITSQVYTSFVTALCEASGRIPQDDFEVTDARCHTTVQCQETLGREQYFVGFTTLHGQIYFVKHGFPQKEIKMERD